MNINTSNCQFSHGILAGDNIENASKELKAIAHPLRLQILCFIGKKEVSVQDIVESVGTSQSNISQHLSVLRAKGVVATKKVANRVFYRVESSTVLQMMGVEKKTDK
ncbi:MAG: ArsR family transcriptional regulator [Aquificaceae bacterium]|nr:MAG: ArsR family transcriptional regulator [Aquificaceae bacterium]